MPVEQVIVYIIIINIIDIWNVPDGKVWFIRWRKLNINYVMMLRHDFESRLEGSP
jgi:hypothetical protein